MKRIKLGLYLMGLVSMIVPVGLMAYKFDLNWSQIGFMVWPGLLALACVWMAAQVDSYSRGYQDALDDDAHIERFQGQEANRA